MSCSGAGGGWPWRASGRSRTSLTILGMHPGTLRKEARRAEADSGRRPDLLSSGERDEIRRLRRENYPLRHANGILRSASLFSRASSTRTVRRASPPLEGRADPPHRGRVGVHLLPAQDRPAQRAGGRGRAAAGPHPRVPCRELLRLWLPAHLEGAAVRWRRGRSRPGQAADACPPNSGRQAQRQAVAHHQTGPGPPPAARLVQRDLSAGRAGPAVGRRSVLPALPGGGLCSSFVLDAFSNKVVGWQLASHLRTTLVLDALRTALGTRALAADVALVRHSDRGSRYTSIDSTQARPTTELWPRSARWGTRTKTRSPRASSTAQDRADRGPGLVLQAAARPAAVEYIGTGRLVLAILKRRSRWQGLSAVRGCCSR
jgi:transposase InsO family protein